LEDLIGKKILVAIQDGKEAGYTVTLHATEIRGIWIEIKEYERILWIPDKETHQEAKATNSKACILHPLRTDSFFGFFSTELDEETLRGS
jgi:hypothetical protein